MKREIAKQTNWKGLTFASEMSRRKKEQERNNSKNSEEKKIQKCDTKEVKDEKNIGFVFSNFPQGQLQTWLVNSWMCSKGESRRRGRKKILLGLGARTNMIQEFILMEFEQLSGFFFFVERGAFD